VTALIGATRETRALGVCVAMRGSISPVAGGRCSGAAVPPTSHLVPGGSQAGPLLVIAEKSGASRPGEGRDPIGVVVKPQQQSSANPPVGNQLRRAAPVDPDLEASVDLRMILAVHPCRCHRVGGRGRPSGSYKRDGPELACGGARHEHVAASSSAGRVVVRCIETRPVAEPTAARACAPPSRAHRDRSRGAALGRRSIPDGHAAIGRAARERIQVAPRPIAGHWRMRIPLQNADARSIR